MVHSKGGGDTSTEAAPLSINIDGVGKCCLWEREVLETDFKKRHFSFSKCHASLLFHVCIQFTNTLETTLLGCKAAKVNRTQSLFWRDLVTCGGGVVGGECQNYKQVLTCLPGQRCWEEAASLTEGNKKGNTGTCPPGPRMQGPRTSGSHRGLRWPTC